MSQCGKQDSFLVLVLLHSIFDVLYSLFKFESKYVLSAHQNIILPYKLIQKNI